MSTDNKTSENSHSNPLALSDELMQEGIIEKFVKDNRINSVVLSFNHEYKKKNFIYPIPAAEKINWPVIIEKIAKLLRTGGISADHILMIEDVLNTNYEIVIGVAESNQGNDTSTNDKKKEVCYIHKFTANGEMPLHESVVFTDSGQSAFVYFDSDNKLRFINQIERPDKILYPADNLDSQNPLPYKFASTEELQMYVELARRETLDSLYQSVKSNFMRYANVDEHYLVVLSSDVILSYFQEKFPTMHLDIFVGDNGSGKNSAQLVISRLGYRVYYLVSTSAANYFTAYGNVEECQVTIAEDEVGDLDRDYQKQKILKSGYASGGTVPKTDFPNGKRRQGLYNVYGIKWLTMEELPDSKKTRGIFDRSFIYNFVVGHVDYNIKDVIRNAGDPKYKPLFDELMHIHKLLFAYRLIHFNDVIPDIEINLENRNAELTKPSLRLFSCLGNAPNVLEEIRLAHSKFVTEKNDLKSNTIESKLCFAINELNREREANPTCQEYDGLEDYAITNEQIWNKCRLVMGGIDIWGKSEAFYSTEYSRVPHRRISSLIQSKFKAVPFKTSGDNSRRGWKFQKEILDRITSHYTSDPKEIIILTRTAQQKKEKTASDASHASHYKSPQGDFNENNSQNTMSGPGQGSGPEPPSEPAEQLGENGNLEHRYTGTISNLNNNNNNNNNNDGSNSNATISFNKLNNNYNTTEINSKENSLSNLTNSNPITGTNLLLLPDHQSTQIKLYLKMPYRHLKCDATNGKTETNHKAKTKAEQVGSPDIPCIYCNFKDPIEFDLSLHYLEKHRHNLIRLSIGKSSMDDRADYAVALSKKRLLESFEVEDEDENNDDDGFEIEEEE